MTYVVGSAEIEVVPSLKGFDEKIDAQTRDLTAGIRLEPDIAGLRAKLSALDDLTIGVKLDDTAARLKLDALTRDRHVDVDASSGMLGGLVPPAAPTVPSAGGLGAAGAGASAAAPYLGIGITLLSVLATALIPIAAVALGASAALGALFAIAGGGVAIFALLEQRAISTNAAFKAQLTPSLNALSGAFDALVSKNGPALLAPLTAGIRLLAGMLPALTPLITAVSGALMGFLKPLQDAVSSGAFAKFVAQLAPIAGGALSGFGTILLNVGKGLVSMVPALVPLGTTILNGVIKLSDQFAKIGQSPEFKGFIAYVIANMPTVTKVVGNLIAITVGALVALAPLGAGVLKSLATITDGIRAFADNPVVKGIWNFLMIPTADALKAVGHWWSVELPNFIGQALSNAGKWLLDMGGKILGGLVQGLVITIYVVRDFFTGQLQAAVWRWLVAVVPQVVTAGIRWITGLAAGIAQAWPGIVSWFQNIGPNLIRFLAGAGVWLVNTGEQIVHGLQAGIGRMWNGFLGWIHSQIMLIPAAVRDALGIKSPSTVFAEIGEYMGLGLQQGATASIRRAMDATQLQITRRAATLHAQVGATLATQLEATVSGGSGGPTSQQIDQLIKEIQALRAKTPSAQDNAHAAQLAARAGIARTGMA
ncbi:hypothetical protein GCM10023087_18260 [Microbacterium rhizosphaerae]